MGDRLRSIVLLGFIAYGPWHTALHSGARPELALGFSWLATMTGPGLLQFGWWLVLALSLGSALLGSWIKKRPSSLECLAFAPFLFWSLNTRAIDASSGIALLSMAMIGLLLSWWLRGDEFRARFPNVIKWGPLVLLTSLFLGLLIPYLVPHSRINPWVFYPPVYRFVGWVGEGTALSLSSVSLILCVLAAVGAPGWKKAFSILGLILAVSLITMNVHRISLIAVGSVFFLWACLQFKTSRIRFWLGLGAGSLVLVTFLFSPGFARKNNLPWAEDPIATDLRANRPSEGVDRVINTSGRGSLIRQFAPQFFERPWLGQGTGYSRRELRRTESPLLEPLSDYLRILVENGLIGLLLFLSALGAVWHRSRVEGHRSRFAALTFAALLTLMLTENIIVSLSYGYGQLLLIGLLCALNEDQKRHRMPL